MAGEDRHQADAVELLEAIRSEPWRFGFYPAVRRINCVFSDMAVTGKAARLAQDPVRFGQTAHTEFVPATLSEVELIGPEARPKISQYFFGLFGPNGPLPLHITEYARQRKRTGHDDTFAAFADMFHHRMISLFYRAWSQAQPAVQADRPEQDRFSFYLAALSGLGMNAFRDADEMPLRDKLYFSGHLASTPRHAEGLASLLTDYFKVPVRIVEFVAHWLQIPEKDRLRLGQGRDRGLGKLGESTVLGSRVWQRQDKFQVFLGPLTMSEYESFLPGSEAFRKLTAAVRNYLGLELLWEIRLLLKSPERPAARLGRQGQLGWTSWVSGDQGKNVIDDLVLQTGNYA